MGSNLCGGSIVPPNIQSLQKNETKFTVDVYYCSECGFQDSVNVLEASLQHVFPNATVVLRDPS